jgi:EAL domain-containing protein (putative c-di-GMP-specific phosphodiesterase class I)
MYVAKKSGRNTFSYFTQKMQQEAQKRLILINELREGIEQKQFELYYQPIVDINSTQLMCLEAVLRWNHPKKGVLEPDMFIPLAEETGLIETLGEFAEQCALNQLKKWQYYDGQLSISLNKSHYELSSETCVKTLKMKMTTMGIPMESLMIEVNEEVLLSKDKRVIHSLEQYAAQGTALSLNNYGLGHASLKSLQSLPLSLIKIDRALVDEFANDGTVNAMVDGMILMAHSLKLKVVAEGVETEQQKVMLSQKQCDYFQGYLVTKPLPADVLEKQFLYN